MRIARFDKYININEAPRRAVEFRSDIEGDDTLYLFTVSHFRRSALAVAHAVSGAVLRTNAAQDTQPRLLVRSEQRRLRLRRGLDSACGQVVAGHVV